MIEQPGPIKYFSTLKDGYQCQHRLQILCMVTEHIPGTRRDIFWEIFPGLYGFR